MIGESISHYRVIEKLGSGGMGVVYKAEDTVLKRTVALKLLPPEMQRDISARKRFVREAQSAAALDHPFICSIHEVGEYQGSDFIVMEYVAGRTLKDTLKQGLPTLKEAMQMAVEMAEALEAAHEKGIVHRDLKPANIMLTSKGHAKVMDFGLAKLLEARDSAGNEEETLSYMTREGVIIGTVAYMSPEQLTGGLIDIRSDIFSLGIVYYEMVCGEHPFRAGTSIATSDRILHHKPRSVAEINSEASVQLQQLISRLQQPGRRLFPSGPLRGCDTVARTIDFPPAHGIRSVKPGNGPVFPASILRGGSSI